MRAVFFFWVCLFFIGQAAYCGEIEGFGAEDEEVSRVEKCSEILKSRIPTKLQVVSLLKDLVFFNMEPGYKLTLREILWSLESLGESISQREVDFLEETLLLSKKVSVRKWIDVLQNNSSDFASHFKQWFQWFVESEKKSDKKSALKKQSALKLYQFLNKGMPFEDLSGVLEEDDEDDEIQGEPKKENTEGVSAQSTQKTRKKVTANLRKYRRGLLQEKQAK